MQKKYADIIVDISHEKLDRTFQYEIPGELSEQAVIGAAVEIPFGNGNRMIKGYIVGLSDKPEIEAYRIKKIADIKPEGVKVESQMIKLAGWIKENYGSTMNQALRTVVPMKEKVKAKEKRCIMLLADEEEAHRLKAQYEKKHSTAKLRLLEALIENKTISYETAARDLKVSATVIKAFETENIAEVISENVYRNPVRERDQDQYDIELNAEQKFVVEAIMDDYDKGIHKTCLIHGITGSGKTEVYMELIDRVLKKGKQAIVLIPEIALTYQTVMRFCQRFGNRVSIINSRLSKGEKYDQILRAERGEIDVIIGPRSALFTPFRNLGLIVIDEEHEATYKSETIPKYHARETAIKRAELAGATVVLGSATPSVDAYYRAQKGEYRLFEINARTNEAELPEVYTVDLREELKSGNRSILSRKLRELMEDRLRKKEQIILFINRRGYAGFVSCRSCGHVMKCPHCDVSLSEHRNGKLVCHYCGHEEPSVKKCPGCGSSYIGGFRAGTQQIEDVVKKEYPDARVLRMDMDTTREKDGHEKILSAFAEGKADVLVGTQMIVKGHDFPNVTLVGVLAADLSLHSNDYHAGERTFQLLTQAAGRAGRGGKAGEVVIQTYSPDNYSVTAAAKHDYASFYREEIAYRSLMGYPPVSNILAVLVSSKNNEKAAETAEYLKQMIIRDFAGERLRVIGPADESISRVNDFYKKVIYIKNEDYTLLTRVKDNLEKYADEGDLGREVYVHFDFNPMNSY
ncbi:replication restart helicase PriA [Anaerobium acetethylicum]|uniref:Replication restart protein PriA n=1 Tax=Anaerobium acetethylicum TaxID=1619234 RepID=A0A1D3TVA3_9FIRM|nr:primosomal protein N' [Anaerobium acetethylicum]SCP98049.1 replication restart DNA helicase PriA [Anaerobium acetethylicum]